MASSWQLFFHLPHFFLHQVFPILHYESFVPASTRFIRVGGYRMLNAWLTYSKTTNNSPVLQLILLTLQKLPLKVDHLKQVGVGPPQ